MDLYREDIVQSKTRDPNGAHGIYGGEAEKLFEDSRGRQLLQETEVNITGEEARDRIQDEIAMGSWVRPSSNWFREDN